MRHPLWSLRPTRRTALVVGASGVLTIALGAGLAVALLLLTAAVGAVLVDAAALRRPRPTVSTVGPATVPLLVPTPFSLHVDSDPRVARLRQPSPPAVGFDPPDVNGPVLSGTLTGRHRGRHEIDPPYARLVGPLRLVTLDVRLGAPTVIKVIPDLPKARRLAAARRSGGRDDGRVRNQLGVGTDFETIRDYTPDDDIRQVNWVATSRAGRLMTNQYRVDENRDVMCLVDTGRLMASPVGELTRLDVALDALTTLVVEAEENQDRVGALAFADHVQRRLTPRRRAAAAIVDALYDVEPTEVDSDYEEAFVAVGRHKRALVVVFTDLVDENVGRSLLDACAVLRRRHAVMVVSCQDPDLTSTIAHSPTNVRDVLRTAVALDLLEATAQVASRLRALGVVVVEAPAATLGPAAVRAYLRLKARARA